MKKGSREWIIITANMAMEAMAMEAMAMDIRSMGMGQVDEAALFDRIISWF